MKDNFEDKLTNMNYDVLEAVLESVKRSLEAGEIAAAHRMLREISESLKVMRSRELRKNKLEAELFEMIRKAESV